MMDLTKSLLVPFVAAFIVQRLLEIIDPFTTAYIKDPTKKKMVTGLASFAIGFLVCWGWHIGLLALLHQAVPDGTRSDLSSNPADPFPVLDYIFSGVFISAGTEGFNSLMKFANYKKEASKADAANKLKATSPDAIKAVNPQQ